MSLNSPKKLFKVASEYNVSTQSIVDALSGKGYAVPNRPNSTITPEMLAVLDEIYGVDKARNLEYDRHREEYESRRTQMLTGKDEVVSATRFSEPSLEPSLSPIEPGLEPLESLEPVDESSDDEGQLSDSVEIGEADLSEEVIQELESEALTETKEEVVTEEAAVKATEDDQDIDKELTEPFESTEEYESATESEEDEQIPAEIKPDSVTPTQDGEAIVRAKADKLKGTKVLGKVQINRDEFPGQRSKPAAKRKRKKDRLPGEPPLLLETDAASKKKKTKKIKIQEEEVQKAVRETMQAIQQGDTAGSKRAKRRKQRREERQEEAQLAHLEKMIQQEGTIEVTEFVTVSDLAELLKVSANQVIMACMNIGQMVSINQRLDASTIELVAANFDREVIFVDAEDLLEDSLVAIEDDEKDLVPRAPIITVMGHVDHGKTSLLDYIRKAKVAAGEAGGITQHVGAYEVRTSTGKMITFLDTPGHEAFTAMRSRGAQATDIVILVVAADDSVMPQTIEAINHAKAAEVPIVVAINKVDKEGANPDKIKQQLSEYGVIVEEWGGSNQSAEVSAKTGQGIDDLLDKVLIEAELMDLRANPNRQAEGIVLEARIDKGKGIVANVLVQKGTLKVGDPFVAGPCSGRVRAMENEHSQRLSEAGPSVPVQLTGFDDIPQAGDRVVAIKDEKTAKEIANQRQQIKREQTLRKTKHLTLDDLSRRMALGEISELNIIIKADVDGSIEALSGSLQKLSTDEVAVNIIHTGSGAITESDVLLASASDAIIIGFQVRPTTTARKLAESESIDVRLFSVIYDAIDEVKDALEGLLRPEIKEEIRGTADVREVFKIAKVGTIAGCYVIDGKIERNNKVRVIRDGIVIFDGNIDALKRFKDDVREVATGYECGITVQNFNDIKVGDQIESYLITEEKRKLE